MDLPLYTSDEVSREHVRLRRDPASGAFTILDKSRNGTWVNGKRLPRDKEQALPDRAEIALGRVVEALLRGAAMTQLYQWHTPFVWRFWRSWSRSFS